MIIDERSNKIKSDDGPLNRSIVVNGDLDQSTYGELVGKND